jgi:TonB family protein
MGRMLAAWAATIGLGLLAAGTALAQEAPDGTPRATQADWVAKPSGDDMAEAYPPVAETLGVTGHVLLACKVATTGRVEDCQVTSETPPGFGFGAAALKVAPLFQMAPSTVGGSATVSTVRIPIRFALPRPDTPKAPVKAGEAADPAAAFTALQVVALVLLTIVSVPAAAALNDRLRRRGARTAGIGPALSRGFGLVGPALRRTPVPLAIYAGLVALSQIVGPAPGPKPDMPGMGRLLAVMPLVLAGAMLAYGGAYRVAFQGRDDPAFRIRRLGLQIGRVEGRLFLSGLVTLILFLVGEVGLGVLAFFAVRAAAGPGAPVIALAAGPCLLAATGLLMACRLSTFVPAWVAEGRERLGAGWGATRACLLPPMMVGLVVVLLMGVVLGGLAMPVRVVLEELVPGAGRVIAGLLYGALAVLFVPIRVGVSAYFYEALQAPEPGSDSP